MSYPWHPTSPGHTLVVSIDSPDPPEQSQTTPDPYLDHPNLSLCIPKLTAVSLNPSALSPNSIWSTQPFPSPTTSPKLAWPLLVIIILSDVLSYLIGLWPLPNASGNFPAPSPMLPDWFLTENIPEGLQAFAQTSQPTSTSLEYSFFVITHG